MRGRSGWRRGFAVTAALLACAIANSAAAAPCDNGANPVRVSATTLAFGTYDASAPAADTSNGTVTVRCANPTRTLPSFTVTLSRGGASTYAGRRMTFGANTLTYNIYTTSAYTVIWGDGTSGTGVQNYNAATLLSTFSYTTFGRVPANQFVSAGSYTDSVTVTVTY